MTTMMPAPILRGSFADSLPSDLMELATWLNWRLDEKERPTCPKCGSRRRIAANKINLFWACVNRKVCGVNPRPVDEAKVYTYAKSRLRHQPKDCYRAPTRRQMR